MTRVGVALIALGGWLGLTWSASVAFADKDKKYTIADLKLLVQQKSYQEAIEHLGDVAPSDRNADWQDLAGQAATGFVSGSHDALAKLQSMIGLERQYPVVMKSAKYVALRTEVGPKGFEACFHSYEVQECFDWAVKFVDDDASNGKLALAVAKTARRNMVSSGAVPLFKRALAANKAGTVCKDSDLQEAVTNSFGLPSESELAVAGRELAAGCWTELKKPVLDELAKGEGAYFRDNACALLKAKKELRGDAAKRCAEDQ